MPITVHPQSFFELWDLRPWPSATLRQREIAEAEAALKAWFIVTIPRWFIVYLPPCSQLGCLMMLRCFISLQCQSTWKSLAYGFSLPGHAEDLPRKTWGGSKCWMWQVLVRFPYCTIPLAWPPPLCIKQIRIRDMLIWFEGQTVELPLSGKTLRDRSQDFSSYHWCFRTDRDRVNFGEEDPCQPCLVDHWFLYQLKFGGCGQSWWFGPGLDPHSWSQSSCEVGRWLQLSVPTRGTVVNPMVPMIVNLNQDPQLQGRDPWLVKLWTRDGYVFNWPRNLNGFVTKSWLLSLSHPQKVRW